MLTLRYLRYWHTRYNNLLFNGKLTKVPIITRELVEGDKAEGMYWPHDNHIEVDWSLEQREARCALLHEMVHQWQHESGLPVDHGPAFENWKATCFARTGLHI